MDFDLLFALIFVVVIVSIVMATLGGVAKRALRLKEKRLDMAQGQSAPAPELVQLMHKMEDRLRVLERIATQDAPALGDRALAQEIEALRLTGEGEQLTPKEQQPREEAQ